MKIATQDFYLKNKFIAFYFRQNLNFNCNGKIVLKIHKEWVKCWFVLLGIFWQNFIRFITTSFLSHLTCIAWLYWEPFFWEICKDFPFSQGSLKSLKVKYFFSEVPSVMSFFWKIYKIASAKYHALNWLTCIGLFA